MKITIVTGPFLPVPPAPCGAVERVWNDLAKEMARRGHDVTIICRDHEKLPKEPLRDNVRYIPITPFTSTPRLALNLLKDFAYTTRALAALPKADILVTNTFWLPPLAGWLRPSAGAIHLHVQRVPKGQMGMYIRSRIARIAAVSSAIRNFIIEECPAAAPLIRIFPNPIDTDTFVPPAQPRDYSREQTLLYTGRIHPEKGLLLLADAFRIFRQRNPASQLRLRLVGPWKVEDGGGGQPYVDQLRQRLGDIPFDMPGPIYGRQELARELQQAHFYVYPSQAERGEASPVAPLEAMATGLVPIVSDLPQFMDYLTDGETGAVFNHRGETGPENLARLLERLTQTPVTELQAWSERAARQGARFSISHIAELYLKDFEELVRARR